MSLQAFMYAADALRLEEGIGFHVETAPGVVGPAVPSPEENRSRNAEAMQNLMGMMGGVQAAPGSARPRGRRRR